MKIQVSRRDLPGVQENYTDIVGSSRVNLPLINGLSLLKGCTSTIFKVLNFLHLTQTSSNSYIANEDFSYMFEARRIRQCSEMFHIINDYKDTSTIYNANLLRG